MANQSNGTASIQRVRKGIQLIIGLILVALLYMHHGWLLQFFQ